MPCGGGATHAASGDFRRCQAVGVRATKGRWRRLSHGGCAPGRLALHLPSPRAACQNGPRMPAAGEGDRGREGAHAARSGWPSGGTKSQPFSEYKTWSSRKYVSRRARTALLSVEWGEGGPARRWRSKHWVSCGAGAVLRDGAPLKYSGGEEESSGYTVTAVGCLDHGSKAGTLAGQRFQLVAHYSSLQKHK